MSFVEKMAKTVEEAVQDALAHLKANRDDVDVEILDAGTKGILGIGAKPARVKVTLHYNPEKIAQDFIKEMGVAMGIAIDVKATAADKQLDIVMSGENMGVLIGKRGQTLDNLQYLVSLAVNKGTAPFLNVSLDAEDYRQRRKESLEKLALSIARKVKTTKRSVKLEPMSTFERRIIHAALQGDRGITTHSEGKDPYRNIVIAPKR
ncbi:MAG: protein jag [Defluviitaleaceae bacterium]|nr:protein jag [Defluviitaleaceae bacterium]